MRVARRSLRTPLAYLALAASALPLLACAADPPLTAAHAPAPPALLAPPSSAAVAGTPVAAPQFRWRHELEQAAEGLLYMSESDYPFEYFFRTAHVEGELDADSFRTIAGIDPTEPLEQISLDDFFARHIERVDPYDSVAVALVPRYENLRETIRASLNAPRVFRVGRIVIHCYDVGTDDRGDVVGLTTTAIET